MVSTIQEALREVEVSYKNPSKVERREGREVRYIEDQRVGMVRVPELPEADTVKHFFARCKEDLIFAKMAAALALSYGPTLIGGEER